MKLIELANYAIIKPDIYAYNYYTPFGEVASTLAEWRAESKGNEEKSKAFFMKMINYITTACLGALCSLLDLEDINNVQFMKLVYKLNDLHNTVSNKPNFENITPLIDFFAACNDILNTKKSIDVNKLRNELKTAIKTVIDDKKDAKLLTKAIGRASDEALVETTKHLREEALRIFLQNSDIDKYEVRFSAPEHYEEYLEKYDEVWASKLVCLLFSPLETGYFFLDGLARSDARCKKFEELEDVPPIILINEHRMRNERLMLISLACGLLNKDLTKEDVIKLFDEYIELNNELKCRIKNENDFNDTVLNNFVMNLRNKYKKDNIFNYEQQE